MIVVFAGTIFVMSSYELSKEVLFSGTLSPWESHLITILVAATIAVTSAFFMSKRFSRLDEQLRIAAIAFESQDGMIITDSEKNVIQVNGAFTHITGYSAEEVTGKIPPIFNSGLQDEVFYASVWEKIQHSGKWEGDIWNRRKTGELYPENLTITAVKGVSGIATHYVVTFVDITERKQTEEMIHDFAFYDALTQLPNRRLFHDRLEHAMVGSKRNSHYGALMFLDLDNFKPLNDKYGHEVGDSLLVEAAHRIGNCIREVDTVARYGGDEFVVLIGELAKGKTDSIAQAGLVAEKIREALSLKYVLKFNRNDGTEAFVEHHCQASIGVVLFMGQELCAKDAVKYADTAMYQAKECGGNQIRFVDY